MSHETGGISDQPGRDAQARLNQPRVTSEQARTQRERMRRASEKFSADAKCATSSRGLAKTPA
jgi:hypothetical protein